jgi:type II secretory pathway component PulC
MVAKTSKSKKAAAKKTSSKKSAQKKWSASVTEHSNAMDLEKDVFKQKDPQKIAQSVKRSAEKSKRKKAGPFQSAMSMINFYENRGGKNISARQKNVLDQSKEELRKLFGREE